MTKNKKSKNNELYNISVFEGDTRKEFYAYESDFKILTGHIVINKYYVHIYQHFNCRMHFLELSSKFRNDYEYQYGIRIMLSDFYDLLTEILNEHKSTNYNQFHQLCDRKIMASHFIMEKFDENKLILEDKTEEFNKRVEDIKVSIEKKIFDYCENIRLNTKSKSEKIAPRIGEKIAHIPWYKRLLNFDFILGPI